MNETFELGCIICGGPAAHTGVFIPNEKAALMLGQPDGKQRMAIYQLCQACMELPTTERNDKIDQIILGDGPIVTKTVQ